MYECLNVCMLVHACLGVWMIMTCHEKSCVWHAIAMGTWWNDKDAAKCVGCTPYLSCDTIVEGVRWVLTMYVGTWYNTCVGLCGTRGEGWGMNVETCRVM